MAKALNFYLNNESNKKIIIAKVYSNHDGSFRTEAIDKELKTFISNLINKVAKENPKLGLRTGGETEEGVHYTAIREISVKEDEYLDALWDYINNHKEESNFKGEHPHVFTEEE